MCKINGHSLFSYFAQPFNTSKLYTSKKRAAEVTAAQRAAEEAALANHSDGDETAETATTAKINNKNKKNQNLSSLRVPLESQSIGTSVNTTNPLGLNLGG